MVYLLGGYLDEDMEGRKIDKGKQVFTIVIELLKEKQQDICNTKVKIESSYFSMN